MVDARDGTPGRIEPDLASRQAAIAAIGWLVLAVLFQVVVQLRILFPEPLGGIEVLSYGRLRAVADTAFVFGWLGAAGFCAMFSIVPRAVGAQLHNEILGATVVVWWHIVMIAGVATLLLGLNQGRPLAELPVGIDVAVVILTLLVFYAVAMTAVRRNEQNLYVSVWYLTAAALLFPVLYATGNAGAFGGMQDALVSAFYLGGLEFLWLVPVAVGTAYYILPASTGNAIPSRSLAAIGFWTLIFAGGWTGVRYLVGSPIPEYLQAIGVGMTFVVLIPVLTAVANLVGVLRDRWDVVAHPTAARYCVVSMLVLVLWTVMSAVTSIPSIHRMVGLTSWGAGLRTLALGGIFSFTAFALVVYMYPLLVGRTWYSVRASSFHFWATGAGFALVVAAQLSGGLVQGAVALTVSQVGDPSLGPQAAQTTAFVMRSFHWVQLAGWLLVALAQFVFAWNAARTSRSGEPVQLFAMAQPASVRSPA